MRAGTPGAAVRQFIPIDLNAFLYKLERYRQHISALKANVTPRRYFAEASDRRAPP